VKPVVRLCVRLLLRILPGEFRRRHGEEIAEYFGEKSDDIRARLGRIGVVRFWLRGCFDVLRAGVAERFEEQRGVRAERLQARRPGYEIVTTIVRDVARGCRTMRRSPGLTVVALLTLALCIGANTAIFSVFNGVLLRPLPYANAEEIVNVWQVDFDWMESGDPRFSEAATAFPISWPVFEDWRDRAPSFASVGAYGFNRLTVNVDGHPESLSGINATSGVFRVLGVPPHLGRTLSREEDEVGAEPTIVLSYGVWQQLYGGDSTVVGRVIHAESQSYTIIGVMPPHFFFPSRSTRFWSTFADDVKQSGRDWQWGMAVARLLPGLSDSQAQREMDAWNQQIIEHRKGEHERGVRVVSRLDEVVGDVRLVLIVLLSAVGLVLLIGCANITNLLLMRATERRHELAIRTALGARRGRLLRHLMSEGLALAVVGGAVGIIGAFAIFPLILSALPSSLPRVDDVSLDGNVLLFAVGLSLASGVLVGILPARNATRADVASMLQDHSRGQTAHRRQRVLQGTLVIVETAVAFMVIAASAVLFKSFVRLTTVERGFSSEGVIACRFQMPVESRVDIQARNNLLRELGDELNVIPGVSNVALANNMPFVSGMSSGTTFLENRTGTVETGVERSAVTAGYFEVLDIPILAGRAFTEMDRPGSPPVTIVSEGMAQEYWPNEDPIGARVKVGELDSDSPWMTVIGVAGDVRHRGLHVEPQPKLYRSLLQSSSHSSWVVSVAIQTQHDANAVVGPVRDVLGRVLPEVPTPTITSLDQLISRSVMMPRFRTQLMTMLAGLAGLLAAVGIYGVLACATAQRFGEIGIRMALGARPSDVVTDVVRSGLALAAIGLTLGIGATLAVFRILRSFLYQTSAHDPMTLVVAVLVILATVLAASCIPALRAAKVDPVEALRHE